MRFNLKIFPVGRKCVISRQQELLINTERQCPRIDLYDMIKPDTVYTYVAIRRTVRTLHSSSISEGSRLTFNKASPNVCLHHLL